MSYIPGFVFRDTETRERKLTALIYDDSNTLVDAIQFPTPRELYKYVSSILRRTRGDNKTAVFACTNGRKIRIGF